MDGLGQLLNRYRLLARPGNGLPAAKLERVVDFYTPAYSGAIHAPYVDRIAGSNAGA